MLKANATPMNPDVAVNADEQTIQSPSLKSAALRNFDLINIRKYPRNAITEDIPSQIDVRNSPDKFKLKSLVAYPTNKKVM